MPHEVVTVVGVKIAYGNLDFHAGDDGVNRVGVIRFMEMTPSF